VPNGPVKWGIRPRTKCPRRLRELEEIVSLPGASDWFASRDRCRVIVEKSDGSDSRHGGYRPSSHLSSRIVT